MENPREEVCITYQCVIYKTNYGTEIEVSTSVVEHCKIYNLKYGENIDFML